MLVAYAQLDVPVWPVLLRTQRHLVRGVLFTEHQVCNKSPGGVSHFIKYHILRSAAQPNMLNCCPTDMEGLDAQALAQLQVDGPLPRQLAGELHLRPPPMDPTELPADAARSPAELGVIFMHLANLGYAIISRRNNLGGQAGCCAGELVD